MNFSIKDKRIFFNLHLSNLALGRYEAVGCLRKTVGVIGGKDLPAEPSEEEFRLGDESSYTISGSKAAPASCYVAIMHFRCNGGPCDSVIIPDGAPLSAYQYFENTHTTDTRKPAFRWLGVRGKVKNEPTLLPESKKRAFGTQFGPFALVTVAKVGVLDNNNVRQTHDWESLSSTFCLQYHNQVVTLQGQYDNDDIQQVVHKIIDTRKPYSQAEFDEVRVQLADFLDDVELNSWKSDGIVYIGFVNDMTIMQSFGNDMNR
uniref:Uncharacterized protein n=1 Tax=Cucumis melo TaxID=3656 RepID=A0A9I9EEI5_CUCME